MANFAYQGEFVRSTEKNKSSKFCVSVYKPDEKFDELPKSGESPYWTQTQEEAINCVLENMKESPNKHTYVIRCLEVTHV